MALPTGTILGILTDNLKLRNSVLPISSKRAVAWSKGLNLPKGGKTIIYTGLMYQLIPFINAMAEKMDSMEESSITSLMPMGRFFNKIMNLTSFMCKENQNACSVYDTMIKVIAQLLINVGVEFGYLYEEELYSGALIYDEGVDSVFIKHAEKVYKTFEKYGVKEVITIDPHTTNILRTVYPKILPEYDIDVKSYLEVLQERKPELYKQINEKVVIHDSCVYARYENVVEEPRYLLRDAGIDIVEPELWGKNTHCCGGPAESLFPAVSKKIALSRKEQLDIEGCTVVTMCPICYVNLQRAFGAKDKALDKVKDISWYLSQAYLEPINKDKKEE